MKLPLWILLAVSPLLISCASTRDPFGQGLRTGHVASLAIPDSLSVMLSILPSQKGSTPFSAKLYARPYQQYRLDAFGFASSIAASYLWTDSTHSTGSGQASSPQAGGHWTLLWIDRREAWEGDGDSLNLENTGLRIPDVHSVLGFLWGESLPKFRNRDDGALAWSGDTLRWSSHGTHWTARFDSSTGNCLEASTSDGALAFRYARHQKYGDRVLPAEVEVFVNGESMLLLRFTRIEEQPSWKKNPFVLKIPEGYETHRSH